MIDNIRCFSTLVKRYVWNLQYRIKVIHGSIMGSLLIGEVMGDRNKDQELFSISVFDSIAHSGGFRLVHHETDYGIDAEVCYLVELEEHGKHRYIPSPHKLILQHKSTGAALLNKDDDTIKYPLEVKNYNNMVYFKDNGSCIVLVLSILTNDTWVECCDNHQKFFNNAYWYIIPEDAVATENVCSITIDVPKKNKFNSNTLNELFNILHKVEIPNVECN